MTNERDLSPELEPNGLKLYRLLPVWLNLDEVALLRGLSSTVEWTSGRQDTGYMKADIFNDGRFAPLIERALDALGQPELYDASLIYYPVGSSIPPHTDPAIEGYCHVRFNVVFASGRGGELYLDGQKLPLDLGDGYLFRPDAVEHQVNQALDPRYIFSVGTNIELEQARALGMA